MSGITDSIKLEFSVIFTTGKSSSIDKYEFLVTGPYKGGKMKFKNILCPVDFSDISRESLHKAAVMAKQYGARLMVLHAMLRTPWISPPMPAIPANIGQYQEEIEEYSKRSLTEMARELVPVEVETELVLETGDPSYIITETAKTKEADLIIMASRENSILDRVLFGSVAEKVLRSASCPILILKNNSD
jgi:universal stress protein A